MLSPVGGVAGFGLWFAVAILSIAAYAPVSCSGLSGAYSDALDDCRWPRPM